MRGLHDFWTGALLGSFMSATLAVCLLGPSPALIAHPPASGGYEPLSENERLMPVLEQRMTPRTIEIVVDERGVFDRTAPLGAKTAAYTEVTAAPCRVHVPEGWLLRYAPSTGEVAWNRMEDSDTLAHELIHCYRGDWHPAWNKILASMGMKPVKGGD